MKTRNDIDENLKWDIALFSSKDEIEETFKLLATLTSEVEKYYNKFNDSEMFFDYFLIHAKKFLKVEHLAFYISNTLNTDSANVEMLKLSQRFDTQFAKYEKASSFVHPQLYELADEYLLNLLKDERAKNLDNIIKDIIKSKPHKLDEATNKVLSAINESFNNSEEVFETFTNSEMPFVDAIDTDGKTHKVTNAEYSALVSSTDRKLRETAFNSTMDGYGNFNKTFAELFISNLKAEKDFCELKHFDTLLDECLFAEDVPKQVFENNIKCVNDNVNLLQEFVKTLNEESGLKDFAYYDLFEDKKISGKISIEQGKATILNALAPLGEEYVSMVKQKFNDKSIDYMPNQNKRSGAYCSGIYQAKTLILMNWTDDYNSMSTLIHEMGHCINNEYYNKYQPMEKAEITIFSAEIASTVNEILLNLYMQKHSDSAQKKYYIKNFLNDVRSTIYRQTLFAEFEYFAHSEIEKEEPITYTELNNKYIELNKKYYGDSCVLPDNLKFEWSRIPHFYSPYYVFSYSTGLITAISIASKLQSDPNFKDKYIEFLKNGTAKPGVEALKEIGIDLNTAKPFEDAFAFIKTQLDELKSL